eukprot:1032670-Prorocentrum_minimum.AAC.1
MSFSRWGAKEHLSPQLSLDRTRLLGPRNVPYAGFSSGSSARRKDSGPVASQIADRIPMLDGSSRSLMLHTPHVGAPRPR